jgi:hypothetical protein
MKILFRKNSSRKLAENLLGQDPDPNVFKSQIRSKIVRIRNTAFYNSKLLALVEAMGEQQLIYCIISIFRFLFF